MTTSELSLDVLRAVPKVLLHDHLDGGLRPQTIIELAVGDPQVEASLPAPDAAGLGQWFRDNADSGSLERYLETFDQTLAVMQTEEGLFRVASEAAQDLAADGVVYAEIRYAPEQHLQRGLTLEQVVEAVNDGFREGERLARESGHRIRVTALLTAMRHAAKSREIAELAVRYRNDGVAGFDIAGAEAGYPPTRHLDAFEFLRRENAHFTIHAGEAFGLKSIWEAIQWCGADRLGHGVRIVDDITVEGAAVPGVARGRRRAGPHDVGRRRPGLGVPGAAGGLRPRRPDPAGDVPQQQPPDRRREVHRTPSDLAARPDEVPGHPQHRQPADERHVPVA